MQKWSCQERAVLSVLFTKKDKASFYIVVLPILLVVMHLCIFAIRDQTIPDLFEIGSTMLRPIQRRVFWSFLALHTIVGCVILYYLPTLLSNITTTIKAQMRSYNYPYFILYVHFISDVDN